MIISHYVDFVNSFCNKLISSGKEPILAYNLDSISGVGCSKSGIITALIPALYTDKMPLMLSSTPMH